MTQPAFTFIDLFAGIGGFHAVLSSMGGKCVYACEIDKKAAKVYETNWGLNPLADITKDANDTTMNVPPHDVLVAGFPCQPFSKGGKQKGMEETRGTLYWNILKIIQAHKPKLVLLENVRNLAGPRHTHEWEVIIETLRQEGYRVSPTPAFLSPHAIPPEKGGRPQNRERVFISATLDPSLLNPQENDPNLEELYIPPVVKTKMFPEWNPQKWDLSTDLPLMTFADSKLPDNCKLSKDETLWIDAWDEFTREILTIDKTLPKFPIWVEAWKKRTVIPSGTPSWKRKIIEKNASFYKKHSNLLDGWIKKWNVHEFPASRQKLEWQAQDTPRLWDTLMHFRPSGIRAKAPTYVPALVAITQTSIYGPQRRKLTVRETARLQGLPDWFTFGEQPDAASYKQMGNGVNTGVVWCVLKAHAERDKDLLQHTHKGLYDAINTAPSFPHIKPHR